MAAPKRPTHEVVHGKLYMAVDGVLQHVKKGTPLVLTEDQVKSLGKKVKVLGEEETVDLTGSGNKTDYSKMKLKQLKAACKKAGIEHDKDAKEEDLIKLLEGQSES